MGSRKTRRVKRRIIISLLGAIIAGGLLYLIAPIFSADQLPDTPDKNMTESVDQTRQSTKSTTSQATSANQSKKTTQTSNTGTLKKPNEPKNAPFPIAATVANQAIDQYLKSVGFSGTAVIVKGGQVLISQGYGLANQAENKPNTPKTRMMIGSAQKVLIATAVLQLVQQKKLNLTDSISRYYPEFPNGDHITIQNFLTHTSGIVGRTQTGNVVTPDELVKEIEAKGIAQPPGTWHYLDSNYEVLANLVQKITQQPLKDYLTEHVFKPAGMEGFGFQDDFYHEAEAAKSYRLKDGVANETPLPELSQVFGAGDIYMTATDLYRFDQALMENKLLLPAEKAAMLTPGSSSTYGMGFYVNPGSYMSHGVIAGFNTINSMSRDGKTYIVLLGNSNAVSSLGQVVDHIYGLLAAT